MCDRIVNGNFLFLANENVIDFLIKKGLDVNHRSKNGHTALHYAAMGSSKRLNRTSKQLIQFDEQEINLLNFLLQATLRWLNCC